MKKYSYHGLNKLGVIASQVTGVMAIGLFTVCSFFLIFGMIKIEEIEMNDSILENPKFTLLCLVLFFTTIAWGFGLTFINYLPTIWIGNEGLVISAFVFLKIHISWEDIIDIKPGKVNGNLVLVRSKRITPFHIIYGWLYSSTFFPSFLIGQKIQNREQLIHEIRQHI